MENKKSNNNNIHNIITTTIIIIVTKITTVKIRVLHQHTPRTKWQ